MEIDSDGVLKLGGVCATELVKEYGTPLYVIEKDKILASMKSYTDALNKHYNGNGLVFYASKAFCCKEMCKIAASCGFGLDVVSHGELYTAHKAGFDMKKIAFHGNNKTRAELTMALDLGVGRIVVDNLTELNLLNSLAKERGVVQPVLLRVKPGVDAHSHSYVCTGQIDSKFGFAVETGEALDAALAALRYKNLKLLGLHCHIGSQILSIKPYEVAVEVMVKLMCDIKEQGGVELSELNLGGGFGICYTSNEKALDIDACVGQIANALDASCRQYGIKKPFIMLEPGRSIVAPAGTTLYTVGSVKHIPNIRTYVAIDGGMTDNPRYALYKSEYEMALANKANLQKDTVVTVAGKCCESGDLLGENVKLQCAEVGDILAVFCTGAYNFSMFSHYNRNLRPPVVMVCGGKAQVIVKGDTLDDIIKNDL